MKIIETKETLNLSGRSISEQLEELNKLIVFRTTCKLVQAKVNNGNCITGEEIDSVLNFKCTL